MSSPLATHLADRFASDAAALRTRADAMRGTPGRAGPSAQACVTMADACDRVRALFTDVESDEAAAALLPTLAGLVAGARSEPERHVYAGAVSRLQQALDGDADDHDEDDEEDDA